MVCPTCGSEMPRTTGKYQFRECGLDFVWLDNWPIFECPQNHATMPLLPANTEDIDRAIALELVLSTGALDADSIRFLRAALKMTSVELAKIISVTRIEVSRWENGHITISALPDLRLRLHVIDCLVKDRKERDELRSSLMALFQEIYKEAEEREEDVHVPSSELLAPA
jgi:DNA-binding transcriptional regulator YiaG